MTRSPFRGHLDPQRPAAPWEQGNFWGQYPDETELPNVAGAKIQLDSVQRGDIAWSVDTNALFVCVDETVGAAVWHQIFVNGPAIEDHQTAKIIVGNVLAGDDDSVCDILDPGDGTGIRQALLDANEGDDVYLRPGVYNLGLDNGNAGPIVIPQTVTLRGYPQLQNPFVRSHILGRAGGDRQIIDASAGFSRIEDVALVVPPANTVAPLPAGSDHVMSVGIANEVIRVTIECPDTDDQTEAQIDADTLRTAFLNTGFLGYYDTCRISFGFKRQSFDSGNDPFVGFRFVPFFLPSLAPENAFESRNCVIGECDIQMKTEGGLVFSPLLQQNVLAGGNVFVDEARFFQPGVTGFLDGAPFGAVVRDSQFAFFVDVVSGVTTAAVEEFADGFPKRGTRLDNISVLIPPILATPPDYGVLVHVDNGGSVDRTAIRSNYFEVLATAGVSLASTDVTKSLVTTNVFLPQATPIDDSGSGSEVAHNVT